MNNFDYQKTLERNRAVYHGSLWDVFCYIRNLSLVTGGVFVARKLITEDPNAPATNSIGFFIVLAIAFLLFFTYKRITGYKLERISTSLSQEENHKFVRYFLDTSEEYGLALSEAEYIIMQRQGFGLGLYTPHQLTILLFEGYILFNGQNINRHGYLFPLFTGNSVIRRELVNALHRFKASVV